MITIIHYGMGNVGSIANMLRKLNLACTISDEPEAIARATKLILPGVGAFDHGMSRLQEMALVPALQHAVIERRVPILGICLGMQLMTRGSGEGALPGLGWIPGDTRRFDFEGLQLPRRLPIPHMGWNQVDFGEDARLRVVDPQPRYYFVHSFHVTCDEAADVAATATYGYRFVAAFQRDNVYGVQFHPEKSHRFGMQLMRAYGEL